MNCKWCDKPTHNECCCKDCYTYWLYYKTNRYAKLSTKVITLICPGCNLRFYKRTSQQLYCTTQCYKKHAPTAITNADKFIIFRRDNFTCIYCGKSSIEDSIKLTVDHIIARSKGGSDCARNLVTACSQCNSCKNDSVLSSEIVERLTKKIIDRMHILNMHPDTIIKGGWH